MFIPSRELCDLANAWVGELETIFGSFSLVDRDIYTRFYVECVWNM